MRDFLARTSSRFELLQRRMVAGLHGSPWSTAAVVAVGLALAAALRYTLLDFKSVDYYSSLKPWYNTLSSQGFGAFAQNFSNYNPPFLYILYLVVRFVPDLPIVVAVKLPALIADFVCAYLVWKIVRLKDGCDPRLALAAGMLVLFAPSQVLNSAFWGQADSVFTAGVLACTYFLMARRNNLALFFFGVALAFKLQAIFLAPLLLALWLRGSIPWKSFLFVPGVLLLAIVPAWTAGRAFVDLLSVYIGQASQYEYITMNAPSVYAWLPGSKQVFNLLYLPGVIMGVAAAFVVFLVILKAPRPLSTPLILELSLAAMLIVPFFLPKMHERYFYPTDILSIAFAFFCPEFYYVPLLIGGTSFFSYLPFLFETEVVPLPVLTLVLLIVISVLSYHLVRELYASDRHRQAAENTLPRDATSSADPGVGMSPE
jgi:Gpi18-like mannosyltransferase